MMAAKDFVTIAACAVGLLTGLAVVLFNTAVHEIRDFFWDGFPNRGASWLREEPIEVVWQRVILVPVCGGVIVGMLNSLRNYIENPSNDNTLAFNVKGALGPVLKTVAASVTLGTGNSLGPEGPSVEIGSAIAKGVGHVFGWTGGKRLSLVASGSAAGISSGFNAAVAGCFFAVESVLWPSTANPSSPLMNSTHMVGMAATLAGVCQVPLTSVLLLFELTQDYRIVLPLLGAVGLSSWIASSLNRKMDALDKLNRNQQRKPIPHTSGESGSSTVSAEASYTTSLCNLESSLCLYESGNDVGGEAEMITVSQAMKTRYITVLLSTSIVETVTLMLVEKQTCAVIIDSNSFLVGLLQLEEIQEFTRVSRASGVETEVKEILVSDICHLEWKKCRAWTATPDMTLLTAERIMDLHEVNQLPVVSECIDNHKRGRLIGLLDRECISIACRAVATKKLLKSSI